MEPAHDREPAGPSVAVTPEPEVELPNKFPPGSFMYDAQVALDALMRAKVPERIRELGSDNAAKKTALAEEGQV